DGIGSAQTAAQQRAYIQTVHGERFFEAFFEATCRAGIHALQLPEDFLQLRLSFRVTAHGIGIANSSVVVALHVLGEMFVDVTSFVQWASLPLSAIPEHPLDGRPQSLGTVDHE